MMIDSLLSQMEESARAEKVQAARAESSRRRARRAAWIGAAVAVILLLLLWWWVAASAETGDEGAVARADQQSSAVLPAPGPSGDTVLSRSDTGTTTGTTSGGDGTPAGAKTPAVTDRTGTPGHTGPAAAGPQPTTGATGVPSTTPTQPSGPSGPTATVTPGTGVTVDVPLPTLPTLPVLPALAPAGAVTGVDVTACLPKLTNLTVTADVTFANGYVAHDTAVLGLDLLHLTHPVNLSTRIDGVTYLIPSTAHLHLGLCLGL
jgi:hypothetical protein